MEPPVSVAGLADEVAAAYRREPATAEAAVERLLTQRLRALPPWERIAAVERLAGEFEGPGRGERTESGGDVKTADVSRVVTLLLGKGTPVSDLTPEEMLARLAESMNTLFDSLNQVVTVINSTLAGRRGEMETIRHVIGGELRREGGMEAVKAYLDQIQEAFLVAHRAFREAALSRVSAMLAELDPERIDAEAGKGLKFGALRKAELFDLYRDKFLSCKGWVDSGRLADELLREFEKICEKSYKKGKGVVL